MSKDLEFKGCKLAVLCGDLILTFKRDNIATIPFPNCWDLPGGGRENGESPEACALRELHEEFGLKFEQSRIHYKKRVASHTGQGNAYFLVMSVNESELANINFGDEGQYWKLMPVGEYLFKSNAVSSNQKRLKAYLEESGVNC